MKINKKILQLHNEGAAVPQKNVLKTSSSIHVLLMDIIIGKISTKY